jgi:hypothetical protein
MNKMDAALEAGFPRSMARSAKEKIETPEDVAMELMDKALVTGIPTELLVRKFAEGLEATIVKIIQHQGRITDKIEFPDHPTRLEYLKEIVLISRRYQPKTTTQHTGEQGGPIELKALTDEELKQRIQWLERKLGISRPGSDPGGSSTTKQIPWPPRRTLN